MMRCVVLSAAPILDYSFLKDVIRKDDFVICADGGVFHAKKLGIIPNLIVGDFDSGSDDIFKNIETIRYNPHKDFTDTHLAVEEGLKRGIKSFLLLAVTGGRMDHTFANIMTMEYLKNKGCAIRMMDEQNYVTILKNESMVLNPIENYKFSVFPWAGIARGVSINNAEYELFDYTMATDIPLGVSNEFIGKNVEIKVDDGMLIVFLSKD